MRFHFSQGEKEYINQNYIAAEKHFRIILEKENDSEAYVMKGELHKIYAYLGQIAEKKGNEAAAVKYYKKSLMEKPDNENVFIKLYGLLSMDNVSKIELLNSIYAGTVSNLKFLSNMFNNVLSEKIGLYYQYILQKKYFIKADKNIAKNMIVAQNYNKASDTLESELRDVYKFILAAEVINSSVSNRNKLKEILPGEYYAISNKSIWPPEEYDESDPILEDVRIILHNLDKWAGKKYQ